jgi:hypothetical protein
MTTKPPAKSLGSCSSEQPVKPAAAEIPAAHDVSADLADPVHFSTPREHQCPVHGRVLFLRTAETESKHSNQQQWHLHHRLTK